MKPETSSVSSSFPLASAHTHTYIHIYIYIQNNHAQPSLPPSQLQPNESLTIPAHPAWKQPSPRNSAGQPPSGSGLSRPSCWPRATSRPWPPRSRCTTRPSTSPPTTPAPPRAPWPPSTPARSCGAPCAASARPRSRRAITSSPCDDAVPID